MTLPTAPKKITKLDVATMDLSFDFTPVLAVGDTLVAADAAVVRVGDVIAVKRSLVGNVVTVRLSGGTAGVLSEVIVQGTAGSGERPAWSFVVQVVS